jgi:RNA polymerase sigma-70 factor (ECF subfamily)
LTKDTKYTDAQLIQKLISEKDSKWFAILYDRYAPGVYNKCINLTHDKVASQDLTHDIFIKAFTSINSFKGKSSFFTWLYAITYNTCIDYLRKVNLYIDIPISDDNTPIVKDEIDDKELMRIELDRLKILLKEIPTDDKMILLMKYQDEMTIHDIEEVFQIGESAAKMRISRAKKKIIDLYNSRYSHSIY